MKLIEYLRANGISDLEFGRSLRTPVTRQAVHRYKTGVGRPKWSVLEDIREATGGLVTANDFLSVSEEHKAKHEAA